MLLLVARFLSTLGLVLLGFGPLLLLPFLPCGRLPLLRMAFGLLALLAGYGTRGFNLPLSSIFAPLCGLRSLCLLPAKGPPLVSPPYARRA